MSFTKSDLFTWVNRNFIGVRLFSDFFLISDTTPGSKQSEGETPKTYRPLVKHFDPNDENVGFDLAKVKMERSSSPTGSRRQLLLAQASGAKTSGSDGGDGSRNENSESSMPLPPSSFQSRRQNQTSEQQRTNTTTNPAASEKSGDKSESSESGVVAGSTTNDESTKSIDGENETGSVATRGPADDNVGSEAKGQSQSADSGKVTAALEFEEEAECFDLSDDCDEDGVPTGRSKNADQVWPLNSILSIFAVFPVPPRMHFSTVRVFFHRDSVL